MKRIVRIGTYYDALAWINENGGQMYPPKTPDLPTTVTRGRTSIIYWCPEWWCYAPGGKQQGFVFEEQAIAFCEANPTYKMKFIPTRRTSMLALAKELKYDGDPEYLTPGGLVRWFLAEKVKLNCKATYFGKHFQEMARNGSHWHYLYCEQIEPTWAVELDIESAYYTSLLSSKTFFLNQKINGSFEWLHDDDALLRLQGYSDLLKRYKWFRLQMVGILASYRKNWVDREGLPHSTEKEGIRYGAAFNTAHEAIRRLWKQMEYVHHKILGEDVLRIHTDSFLISDSVSNAQLLLLKDFFTERGYTLKIKALGWSYMWRQDLGFIGLPPFGKLIGTEADIKFELENSLRKGYNIKMRRQLPTELVDKFAAYFELSNDIKSATLEKAS